MGFFKFVAIVILLRLQLAVCDESEIMNALFRAPKEMIYENPSEVTVFYSVENKNMIKNMSSRPWFAPGQSLRLPFIGDPCSCNGYQCGCCGGIKISQINFDRQICANISYDSYLFGLVLDVSINNQSVIHNVYSAKNPPPLCIPVPLGPITAITLCIKLYDIYVTNFTTLHTCMDWEIRLISYPLLILHFDCINIGAGGVELVKPDEEYSLSPPTDEQIDESQSNGDIYDEVTEIKSVFAFNSSKVYDFDDNEVDRNRIMTKKF